MNPIIRLSTVTGLLLASLAASTAEAASPNCAVEGGTLLSWPSVDPLWELCWIPPNSSSGPAGSGLELRAIHYRGIRAIDRIHAPLLFAEYSGGSGGDCYRDWKDDGTAVLAHSSTHNQLAVPPDLSRLATTSCSVSDHPTQSFGICPFQQATGNGYSCTGNTGVVIEDLGDEVRLTTQYRADWYMYDSRISFGADGSIEPTFGFGNNNGTYNNVTHWHHNYWRFDFQIDGQSSHVVAANGVDQATEFSDLRGAPGSKTWSVRNTATGRGFQLIPGDDDYDVGTNESGRGFHTVDFMATRYQANEYGDSASNNLFDCDMNQSALVNGASINQQDVALYYRVAVRDTTSNSWPPGCGGAGNPCIPQDSMICKNAGPRLVAFGDWGQGLPSQADLGVLGTSSPEPAAAGGTVELEIVVENEGPQDTTDVTVMLDLPPELELATPPGAGSDWSCAAADPSTIECTLDSGTLAALGQSSFVVGFDVDGGAAEGVIETVATVSSSEWADPDSSDNVTTIETTLVAAEADLAIGVVESADPIAAGDTLELAITVSNAGPQTVQDLTVTLDLPAEFELVGTQRGSPSWQCSEDVPGAVVCTQASASLDPLGEITFTVLLDVAAEAVPGEVATTVGVSSDDFLDPEIGDNSAIVTTTITAPLGIDIFENGFEGTR